jgi:hypothetical protein
MTGMGISTKKDVWLSLRKSLKHPTEMPSLQRLEGQLGTPRKGKGVSV